MYVIAIYKCTLLFTIKCVAFTVFVPLQGQSEYFASHHGKWIKILCIIILIILHYFMHFKIDIYVIEMYDEMLAVEHDIHGIYHLLIGIYKRICFYL